MGIYIYSNQFGFLNIVTEIKLLHSNPDLVKRVSKWSAPGHPKLCISCIYINENFGRTADSEFGFGFWVSQNHAPLETLGSI